MSSLHVRCQPTGWAIEGAVGSAYKIDATYLSPHVNLASRIEAATKLYRLPILMSSAFAIELSPYGQSFLRLLDRIMVKGSALPIELYGFDVDWSSIPPSLGEDAFNQRDEFVDDKQQEAKVAGGCCGIASL